jgi:sterol desaturase/sphingolipid hydroxylase (fatty acid hydroxylase superfamily)
MDLCVDVLPPLRRVSVPILIACFWCWESLRPFQQQQGRWKHGIRNLGLAGANTLVLGLLFGSLFVAVGDEVAQRGYGLLNQWNLSPWIHLVFSFLLLDAWMYLWHWTNHAVPVLWRFHRMHHSDEQMDVTTATRFHLGELFASGCMRLALLPVVGWSVEAILLYDLIVLIATHFHHANIHLGPFDSWLRYLIVTPILHKIHHSDLPHETNSNYATVLSMWDRLFGTYRMRSDPEKIRFGLSEFRAPMWQTLWGMWKTPFSDPSHAQTNGLTAPSQAAVGAGSSSTQSSKRTA